MSEITKFRGARLEMEQREKSLRLKISGLRKAMRDNLDPTYDEARLCADLIHQQAVELAATQIELLSALEEIARIRDLLGE